MKEHIIIAPYQRWTKAGLTSREYSILRADYSLEDLKDISPKDIRRSKDDKVFVKVAKDDYAIINSKNCVLIPFLTKKKDAKKLGMKLFFGLSKKKGIEK